MLIVFRIYLIKPGVLVFVQRCEIVVRFSGKKDLGTFPKDGLLPIFRANAVFFIHGSDVKGIAEIHYLSFNK